MLANLMKPKMLIVLVVLVGGVFAVVQADAASPEEVVAKADAGVATQFTFNTALVAPNGTSIGRVAFGANYQTASFLNALTLTPKTLTFSDGCGPGYHLEKVTGTCEPGEPPGSAGPFPDPGSCALNSWWNGYQCVWERRECPEGSGFNYYKQRCETPGGAPTSTPSQPAPQLPGTIDARTRITGTVVPKNTDGHIKVEATITLTTADGRWFQDQRATTVGARGGAFTLDVIRENIPASGMTGTNEVQVLIKTTARSVAGAPLHDAKSAKLEIVINEGRPVTATFFPAEYTLLVQKGGGEQRATGFLKPVGGE